MVNTINLVKHPRTHLERIQRRVTNKTLVGTLPDDRQCWRGNVQLNSRVQVVETIGDSDSEKWYMPYTLFQVWRRLNDGELVHEEDFNHYPDSVFQGGVIIQEVRGSDHP